MSASRGTTVSELRAGAAAATAGAHPLEQPPSAVRPRPPPLRRLALDSLVSCLQRVPLRGSRCSGLPAVLLFLLPFSGDGSGWHSVEDLLTALLRDKRAGKTTCRRARRQNKTIKFHWSAIRFTTQPRTVPLVRREGSSTVGEGPRARGPQRTSSAAPPSPARPLSRRSQSRSKRAAKRGDAPAVVAVGE